MVVGASRGIGLAMVHARLERSNGPVFATTRNVERAEDLRTLASLNPGRLHLLEVDPCDETSLRKTAEELKHGMLKKGGASPHVYLSTLVNCTGLLHGHLPGKEKMFLPERSLAELDVHWMMENFRVNAIGPALVAKYMSPIILSDLALSSKESQSAPPYGVFASLSARVGSIEDNKLGGWYSYRASKAALNQFTRTMSRDYKWRNKLVALSIHPGTVDTNLSEPFQARVKPEKLFTVERAADQLWKVIDASEPADSGLLKAWDGSTIPF